MTQRLAVLIFGLAFIPFLGCAPTDSNKDAKISTASDRPQVFVTNYPLQYFAQRITGELADVRFPMVEDGDPAFWQPDATSIGQYQAAAAILINGATYEKWLASATLPDTKIVDTSVGFRDKYIHVDDAVTHSHGPEGEHSHSGTAFTTWLDFQQAEQQALAVYEALAKLMPNHTSVLATNLDALREDLKKLDQEMRDVAARIGDRPLIASHPVYDYWARAYGMRLESVHWEPDVVPTDEAIAELSKLLESHPAKAMIWEGTPEPASVDKLNGLGMASLVFDPCGNVSESGDWLTVMRSNIQSLREWSDKQ
jgi:zinc transport system substrate-binding protein